MSFPLDGTKQQASVAKQTVPQITLHTSENAPGTLNAALANFIRTRADYGSYHCIADTTGAELQLAGFRSKVWHAPASNDFAMGLSAVTRAADWTRLSDRARKALVAGLARAAHRYSRWCVAQGVGPVQARRLTRQQALARMSGFCTHGELQPADRTDPGPSFPWNEFLAEFRRLESGATAPVAVRPAPVPAPSKPAPAPKPEPVKEGIVMSAEDVWRYTGRDFLNEKPQFKDTQLARAYQYSQEARNEAREVKAMVKAQSKVLDKLLKSNGEILKAVEDAERQVVQANAKDVAAELQITTKED